MRDILRFRMFLRPISEFQNLIYDYSYFYSLTHGIVVGARHPQQAHTIFGLSYTKMCNSEIGLKYIDVQGLRTMYVLGKKSRRLLSGFSLRLLLFRTKDSVFFF